ncbi:hypothetical protein, partial [Fusobacterium mortiferum]|uniref:hypothetical protein n=1 Tax=Fusobacterium mortiferum TaxID=850 RepID=UPI0001A2B780
KETIIFNKSVAEGNITISQPYSNFHALLVECRCDDNTRGEWHFIPTSTIALNQVTRLGGDSVFWDGKWISTTLFTPTEENSIISKIIGVNF